MTHPPRAKSTAEAVCPAAFAVPTALRGALLAAGLLSSLLAGGCLPDAATIAPEPSGSAGSAGSAGSGAAGAGGNAGSGAGGAGPCVLDASSLDDCLLQ